MSKKQTQKLTAGKEPETTTTLLDEEKARASTIAKEIAAAKAKAEAEAKAKAEKAEAKAKEAEAKKAAREAERAAAKAKREAEKAAKAAAKKDKPARETPAHMAKVDKYAASLPTLSDDAKEVFTQAETLSIGDLNILAAHLQLLSRRRATATAVATKFEVGDRVRIHSGQDTRHIGKEGVVTRVQRARMFVKVPNFSKDAYIFTSNAEHIEATTIDVSDDAADTSDKTATG